MIGNRILVVETADGTKEVEVRLMQPEPWGNAWRCRYSIGWPEGLREGRAGGSDALQALHIALQAIGAELYGSAYHDEGKLYWFRPGEGYGFPVPKTMREDLIGYDKEFY